MSVGDGGGSGGLLVETWNGVAWSATTPAISPYPVVPEFNAVSCVSDVYCIAVGSEYHEPAYQPFAALWNGATWSRLAPIDPTVITTWPTMFNGISCTSTTNCIAVGEYLGATHGIAFAEQWNGQEWSRLPDAARAWAGVSCVSASFCVAVNGQPQLWDGTRWSPMSGGALTFASGVSCVTASFCMAVGSNDPSSPTQTTTSVMWNGSSWSTVPTVGRSGSANVLNAVSCIATTSCVAVGYTVTPFSQTLIETWDGTSWGLVPSPNRLLGQNPLAGVSCTRAPFCFAVGQASNSSSQLTMALLGRGVPAAPTGLTASAGTGSATLSWTAPENHGGATILGYVITPYIGSVAQAPTVFNSTATTEVVTGLTPGTSYRFTVAAKNAYGTGIASTASNAVTPT